MLKEPTAFFEGSREEGYREPFIFLIQVSAIIAFFTPIVNFLGWPSTDRTSTYQAQIIAWQITRDELLPRLGPWAYIVEAFLILALSMIIAALLAGFIHLIYRIVGGQGTILNAWKATCYGTGPCVLLGWLPYWTLIVGSLSFVFQLYYGPKLLYRVRENRALMILACLVGAALMEFAVKGSTVSFGGQ